MAGIETPRPIRGTQDIFGPEAEAFAFVVETFERVRKLYRFRRAEMPVFERTEVFSRSLGETTDVVSKEMYSFEDRGGESLTLRPEFTAGIARADHLGVDLMELAVTPLLRPLIAEQRTVSGDLQRRMLLPAVGEEGARKPGSEFGAQRQRFPAAVLERIHLLGDDVGRLAQRAAEHGGLLEHRHFHPAEPVEPAHALEGLDHEGESFRFGAEDVLSAADRLGRLGSGLVTAHGACA